MRAVQDAFISAGGLVIDDMCYYLRCNVSILYHDGCLAFTKEDYKYILDCKRMLYFRVPMARIPADIMTLICEGGAASLLFNGAECIDYNEGYCAACEAFPEILLSISASPVSLY